MTARSSRIARRRFLQSTTLGTAALVTAPAIFTSKRAAAQDVIGQGDYQFEVQHQWPQLPDRYHWQTTHNVAVDDDGFLYVIHEGRAALTDHPSIFVFDPEGRFVRAFGEQFQGGGHGIEVRQEGSERFLYVAAYQQVKSFAKLTTDGRLVWQRYAPMESGKYAAGEASSPRQLWGRDRFLPTNFAFPAEGGFLLADGYGSFFIHRYDADGHWVGFFGGPGEGQGTFNTPHGLWIDQRDGHEGEIVVTDRAHNTVQILDAQGQYQETLEGFGLPANLDTWQNLMVVPELVARVTLLDEHNQVVAHLGDDRQRVLEDRDKHNGFRLRTEPDRWQNGRFVHPHDACFDRQGNLYVAEWVQTGRITRLRRV